MRFIFYSHDGVGLGHVRRNLAIAAEVVALRPSSAVLLACSADEVDRLTLPPNVDVLKLPAIVKEGNGQYAARRLAVNSHDVLHLRAGIIAGAVWSFRPDVLVADKHPFGVQGELRAALDLLSAHGGKAVLGLRDVLDDPDSVAAEWEPLDLPQEIPHTYDRVLVYGQRDIVDPVTAYSMPPAVDRLTRFCGYVHTAGTPAHRRRSRDDRRPTVLATVGGGGDGDRLLADVIDACVSAPWHTVLVAGPQGNPGVRQALRHRAEAAGLEFRTFVRDLPDRMMDADVLVSMGGYNTISEAMAAGIPTVCVPRTSPRTEQLIRAKAFAARDLLRVVADDSPGSWPMRTAIEDVLTWNRDALRARIDSTLMLNGAATAAAALVELAYAEDEQGVAVLAG